MILKGKGGFYDRELASLYLSVWSYKQKKILFYILRKTHHPSREPCHTRAHKSEYRIKYFILEFFLMGWLGQFLGWKSDISGSYLGSKGGLFVKKKRSTITVHLGKGNSSENSIREFFDCLPHLRGFRCKINPDINRWNHFRFLNSQWWIFRWIPKEGKRGFCFCFKIRQTG